MLGKHYLIYSLEQREKRRKRLRRLFTMLSVCWALNMFFLIALISRDK